MQPSRQQTSGEMPSFFTSAVPSYSARSRSLPIQGNGTGRRGSALASAMGLRRKSELDIVFDGGTEFVHSYSTYDEIKGHVDVKFDKDTAFDDLIITFEGRTSTYVEKISTAAPTTGRTTGRQTFLKVQQPIHEDDLPADGVFRANAAYSIPFTFVVPDRLLPLVCTHKVDNETLRTEHTQLPPSLGDPHVAGEGHALMDDLAPDMAKISYCVRARVVKWSAVGRPLELADKAERVRLVPARAEAPPLSIRETPFSDHVMRKEKSMRKGLFKLGKTGRLTAETSQPRSLRLPHPQKRQTGPISTMATVNLRFDPQTPEDEPPQLDSITTKLKAYTFFAATAYGHMPASGKHDNWSTLHGVYPEQVSLASRRVSAVSWLRHDPSEREMSFSSSELSRRPSSYSTSSTSSIPEPSGFYQEGSPFYTASVIVPVALPTASASNRPKVFVPTFHSCIVSRTYALDLNISFRTPGSNVSSSNLTLKTPIQISAEGGVPPAHLNESAAAIVAEIESQFGLYEAGQLGHHDLGVESPVYEETSSNPALAGTRHMSLADHLHTPPAAASLPLHYSGINATAPPDYHHISGFGAYGARDPPGGPRTQSVSLSLFA
ncbi:hypothetical protein A1O1_04186 [Capronia coronata CBS 617.96]|uniref:Arrestin-like N-terminal domain-containing protein n=1 Tax=Capronia coronata CBS 617.96 TaxID=1182541 RepID=W9Z989_9EURO|nr:uncharacterized protein A1O1_04186 [Capronia coronata CBS 617.96]EXJ91079.1 hypothetical protein A1O1_04186 [Capronia coronata CBS 617.96]